MVPPPRRVHLFIGNKGGVGKSFAAAVTLQHLWRGAAQRGDARPRGFDLDPLAPTLTGYAGLGAEAVNVVTPHGGVNPERLDRLFELVSAGETSAVLDTSPVLYHPLLSYLGSGDVPAALAAAGIPLVVHTVLVGGAARHATRTGLDELLDRLAAPIPFVVWHNGLFGPVPDAADCTPGSTRRASPGETSADPSSNNRVQGVIEFGRVFDDTFGENVRRMVEHRLTFAEAVASPVFGLMAKQRLTMVARELDAQLGPTLARV